MEGELSEKQEKAVKHYEGPAVVVAGPGAGKTLVITERIKYLIRERDVSPERILVTTFTEKASSELQVRLGKSLGTEASRIHISTIHSLCKTLLENYFTEHTLGTDLEILDEASQKLFVDVNKFGLGLFRRKGSSYHWIFPGKNRRKKITRLYNFLTSNNIEIEALKHSLEDHDKFERYEKILDSYLKYKKLLREEGLLDFAHLQLNFFQLISQNKDILREVQNRFDFILVDEYQDTSPVQHKIFKELAAPENNIFVVGDVHQSIYGFRGASLRNFERFTKEFGEGVEQYLLNMNYRSVENIVELSNKAFEKKLNRKLEAYRKKKGKILLLEGETADSTAKKTIELIEKLKEKGKISKYGDVALLFRSWFHSEEYKKYLEKKGIPYVSFGGGSFFDREEIRTLLYLISYVSRKKYMKNQFREWSEWWDARLFKTEVLNFSDKTKKVLENSDHTLNLHEFDSKEDLRKRGICDSDAEKILGLNRIRQRFSESKKTPSLLEAFYDILNCTGYFARLLDKKENGEAEEKLFNIAKFSEIIEKFERIQRRRSIKSFFWFVYKSAKEKAFDQHKIEGDNTVKIMTVHKAKGLEFPVVFLCSMVEERFPLSFRMDKYIVPIDKKFYMDPKTKVERESDFYDEEHRIFYVGLTRAQHNLIFTACKKIRVESRPLSRFLKEIKEYITKDTGDYLKGGGYEVVKEVPKLNYSAMNTYIDCPFRYDLIYNYGFVTPRSFTQNIGVSVHNILQRIHLAIKSGEKVNGEDIQDFVDEYWIPIYTSKKKDKRMKEKYANHILDYYKAIKNDYREIIAIEEPFTHIEGNMIITGKVDLIVKDREENVCLVDFKSMKKKALEITNVGEQLKTYCYCLSGEYDIDKLLAHTILDNERTEFSPAKGETRELLEEMSEKMHSDEFPRNTESGFCEKCEFNFLLGDNS